MPSFANVLDNLHTRARSLVGGLNTNTAVLTAPDTQSLQNSQMNTAFSGELLSNSPYGLGSFTLSNLGVGYIYGFAGGSNTPPAVTPVTQVVPEPSRETLKRVPVEVSEIDLNDPRQKLAMDAETHLGYTPLRTELRAPGALMRVLAKLEIQVLDQKSVDTYKQLMAAHYATAGKLFDPTWRLTLLRSYHQPVPEFVLQKAVEIKRELPEAKFYIDQLAVDPFLIVSLRSLEDYRHNCSRDLDADTAAYIECWAEPKFEASM